MRFAKVFFILVLLLCLFETVRLWYLAPAEMAAHFNLAGNPDRFVPKLEFFGFQLRTALLVTVLSLAAQVLLVILPVQLINMLSREYWLSPEQREATIDRFSSFVAALFAFILLAIQAGFELAVSANLHKPIVFDAQVMVAVIAGFFVITFLMLFWLIRSFQLPSEATQT